MHGARDLGRFDAVVLGGGPAGLSAAWELARGGARTLVVEREDAPGGLCRTHVRDGFRFDMGGHRFITADRDLLDRVVRLMGDDLLLAERTSEVALLGRRFRYPLELPDLLRNLPPGLAVRAVGSFLRARARAALRRGGPPASFEAWAEERFGRVLYELFLGPYTRKVWGEDPAALSAEWATQRISLLDLRDVARWLLAPGRAAPPRTCARSFLYPRLGMGQLFERVADAAAAGGAELLVGTVATGLEVAAGRVQAVRLRRGPEALVARTDWLLSTIPLPALLELAHGPGALPELRAGLPFRPVRFLDVALARGQALPVTWRYVGEARHRAGRLQEPRRRSPEMAPPGRTSLMVEVPHAPGDAVDRASDAELLARLRPELDELGVALGDDVLFAFTVRAPEAYPVHLRAVAASRAAALAALAPLANLRTFGRQGAFRFVFSDAAMRMGLDAAGGVLAGRPPASEALAEVASARRLLEVESVVGEAGRPRS